MTRHLWLDPGFGASGDMLLGTLLGLGAPLEAVHHDLTGLGATGWTLGLDTVDRAGISATRALVDTDHEPQHHRAWSAIDRTLAHSTMPEAVKVGSRRTFELLARVEAAIHGIDVDAVHFHEVGALDAIVDIVGAWSALHHLGVDEVTAGPVGVGNGVVDAAHGRLPAPAPATVALLEGALIRPVDWASETVTPTGAALLRAMVTSWGPIPSGRLVGSSRGAGGRNPSTHPNVLGALLVEREGNATSNPAATTTGLAPDPRTEPALVLATNLDDTTAEILGHTIARLLEAGADDAWVVPIGMKKNRPGHELRVLCHPERAEGLEAIIFAETGTLGLRRELVVKQVLDRRHSDVEVRGHRVRVKVGPHGAKAEHDDLVELSRQTGIPVRQLGTEAAATATATWDTTTAGSDESDASM